MKDEHVPALVIGAGPAGLMAAGELAAAGYPVLIVEAKPSPARKLLMAGKSGLNLTKDEPTAHFVRHYEEASSWLAPIIANFGPKEVCAWAEALGEPVFTGSSGRVFPRSMKASPLLRRWLASLSDRGARLRTGWRWAGFQGGGFVFETPKGKRILTSGRTVLALGGASWSRLGSDGAWANILSEKGVSIAPFKPANMGFEVAWSDKMRPHFGDALKSITLICGARQVRGEVMISVRGLEGGGLYPLSRYLRDGEPLAIDLFPDLTHEAISARLAGRPSAESVSNRLRKALGLAGVRLAILHEFARPLPTDAHSLARLLKSVPVPLQAPRPIDEAISVAGGIRREAVSDDLMLLALPGVFTAGEMLDWEAPTGGYLLTACLATGLWAGRAASRWSGLRDGPRQRDGADDQAAVQQETTAD